MVYRLCANFPTPSDYGIPSKWLVPTRAGRRYNCDTVHSRSAPADGIQSLFSNAYRHQHFEVIEIQTTQRWKIIVSVKYSEFLWTNFTFGHLAANVPVRCSDFSKWPVFTIHLNRHPPYVRHLVWHALLNIATEMADVESFEEMVGTREAAAVATESGGRWRQGPVGRGQPATRRWRRLMTRRRRPVG